MKEAMTFDDVLLVPKKSSVKSRKDVDTSTHLTKKIKMNIPLISTNMDTITESGMAITMARHGGIGIIHRFMSVEEQVAEVKRVKRSESILIETPYVLYPKHTIKDVKAVMSEMGVSGILIVDKNKKLLGIVTRRDIVFEDDFNKKLSEVMTKFKDMIVANQKITMEQAKKIFRKEKIE